MAKGNETSPATAKKAGQANKPSRARKPTPTKAAKPVDGGADGLPPATSDLQETTVAGAHAPSAAESKSESPSGDSSAENTEQPQDLTAPAVTQQPGVADEPAGADPQAPELIDGAGADTAAQGDSALQSGSGIAPESGKPVGGDPLASHDDQVSDDMAPSAGLLLQARLVNGSASVHHVPRARVKVEPGQSVVVEFRDERHRAACERHVDQIRSLYKWPDGEGLRWEVEQ